MPKRKKLTDAQVKAVRLALTSGADQKEIGTACGVTRETICRWFKLPHVQEYMEEMRGKIETDSHDFVLLMFEDLRNDLFKDFKNPQETTANKIKIADLLFKVAGLYKSKIEVSKVDPREEVKKWLDEKSEDVDRLIQASLDEDQD